MEVQQEVGAENQCSRLALAMDGWMGGGDLDLSPQAVRFKSVTAGSKARTA